MKFHAPNWRERRNRWRWRFAVWPVRIHDTYVWLEWYRYRGDIVACDRARTIEEQDRPYSLVCY